MSRCDSAAIVPNTRELFPEPETPVNTVRRRLGISTSTSFRLFTRAPCTRIRSWLSATCRAGGRELVRGAIVSVPPRSAPFLDPEQVACGITEGAVPDAVRLVGRLLHHFGVTGLEPRERRGEVLGRQV